MPEPSSSSARIFYPRFDRNGLVALLRECLPGLSARLPLVRVVLFGSWATGRATAFSDIDLLVVYSGPARDDAHGIVRRSIPIRGLEPHVYSEDEAEGLWDVLDRMTRDGVRLI